MPRDLQHVIAGQAQAGRSGRFGDVFDPTTGAVQAKVAFATADEVRAAIAAAEAAFPAWRAVNPQRRARLLSSEHGKIIADAKGDVQRGLEVIEFACGIPHLQKGEYTEGAGCGSAGERGMATPVAVGMVGINVPIPVPLAFPTFGGWKRSAFGDTNQHGMEGVRFFRHIKTVTARWPETDRSGAEFTIPTMH
jgi:malonate-semialdehyde dehydrogenase (acetylating)/methylmalonate-semialdehyde dehydrogenase